MNMGIIKNHMLRFNISENLPDLPQLIPTMANNIPLKPIVGSQLREGRKEHKKLTIKHKSKSVLQRIIQKHRMFANKWKIFA